MDRRLKLQTKLEGLLGSRNVYYQPPENLKIEYPAIRYSLSKVDGRYADNAKYSKLTRYELIVIGKRPNDKIIDSILDLQYSEHDRHYVVDNLHHDVITLYY